MKFISIFVAFIGFIHAKSSFQNTPLLSCISLLADGTDEPRLSRAADFCMKPYKNLSLMDMPDERWLIINFIDNDNYSISNMGRVKSKAYSQERILKQGLEKIGYLIVSLKSKTMRVHRIVAKLFIDNPFNKPSVNHKDADKLNNRVSNLEWCTPKENDAHAKMLGLKRNCGRKNGNPKLLDKQVLEIRKLRQTGYRYVQLAKMFHVTPENISYIARNITRKSI